MNRPNEGSHVTKFVFGGASCMIAAAVLNPLSLIKIRLQVNPSPNPLTVRQVVSDMIRCEGFRSLFKGLTPALMREASYSSIRMGLYEPMKSLLSGPGDSPILSRYMAGALSGAIGAGIANPTDLVMVRMQASSGKPYPSTISAFIDIYRHEGGIRGLYRGVGPTICRAAVLTSFQLATYETSKRAIISSNISDLFGDNVLTFFTAAMLSGLVTTTAHIPIDVVKSRIMNSTGDLGILQCIREVIRVHGPIRPFFKGWLPAYLRLGPHTVISLVLIDKMRSIVGIKTI